MINFFMIDKLFHDYETRKSNTSSIGHYDASNVHLVYTSCAHFINPESIHTVASVTTATRGFIYNAYTKKGKDIKRNDMLYSNFLISPY